MHAIKALGTVVENPLGVLGFQPVESLVVVAVKGGEVGCVMRLDLRDAALADAPDRLAELALDRSARTGQQGRQPGRPLDVDDPRCSTSRPGPTPRCAPILFHRVRINAGIEPIPLGDSGFHPQTSAPHEPAASAPR